MLCTKYVVPRHARVCVLLVASVPYARGLFVATTLVPSFPPPHPRLCGSLEIAEDGAGGV